MAAGVLVLMPDQLSKLLDASTTYTDAAVDLKRELSSSQRNGLERIGRGEIRHHTQYTYRKGGSEIIRLPDSP